MSEEEKLDLYARLAEAMRRGTINMLVRKAKLGEPVAIADAKGNPMIVSAEEALALFNKK